MSDSPNMRYTLAFIRHQGQILMLHRKYPPNQGLWNGVGGKIKPGETPLQCVLREIREETGLALQDAWFAGTVTWNEIDGRGGLYVYVADLTNLQEDPAVVEGETEEGILRWQEVSWVCTLGNPSVVDNIPMFLSSMLLGDPPAEYFFQYSERGLVDAGRRPLPARLTELATSTYSIETLVAVIQRHDLPGLLEQIADSAHRGDLGEFERLIMTARSLQELAEELDAALRGARAEEVHPHSEAD